MGDNLNVSGVLTMLTDVTRAASASNTKLTLVRRLGETLRRHLAVSAIEVGWCEDLRTALIITYRTGSGVAEVIRDLRGSKILDLIESGKPQFEARRSTGEVLMIPLLDLEKVAGYARISLETPPPEDLVSQPVLETLGSILGFAQCH